MSKKHKKVKSSGQKHTPLAHLQQKGTKLLSPLSSLGIQRLDWERDQLPEFLWVAALAEDQGLDHFHDHYNAFLDVVDSVWSHETTPLGLLSDFGLIGAEKRAQFLRDNEIIVEQLFHKPIGRIIAFYPDCPAHWLVKQSLLAEGGVLNPQTELGYLRRLVTMLMPGKTDFPARVRAVPLNRLLKHRKIFFSDTLQVIQAIPKYPHECDEHEKFMLESMARSAINMSIQERKDLVGFPWSRYFWRHNYNLTPCRERDIQLRCARQVSKDQSRIIQEVLRHNAQTATEYVTVLRSQYRPDLYDPSKDEVLLGLFSRVTRLFVLMMENPSLWARDTGGIMLRCLADSAITFGYLTVAGSNEDFTRFIEYGEGQQKLLMLHLQDNYPDDKSLEGLSSEEISDRLGKFTPELVDIELGHWLKKDARKMASDAGMERLYRLVFNPASSDVHGSWLSLKSSNLIHCLEPLHRFHRLPSLSEPPFFINVAEAARSLYEHCVKTAVDKLHYPTAPILLRDLDDTLRQVSDDSEDPEKQDKE